MSVTVNLAQADQLLRKAIFDVTQNNWIPSGSKLSELIKSVILGSHLTYRYILTTGLVSKATNNSCNPLTLQAGSKLAGAYDARSVCHNVVVPIERELLDGGLGESNEPFLNKPARYQELSSDNPVRKGNDFRLLQTTIEVLSGLESSEHAYICLKDCVYYIFQRPSRNLTAYLENKEIGFNQASLIEFADLLMYESFEGETSALIVGATYSLLGLAQSKVLDVKVHKVNQAGSSSKEISDVDVYENSRLVYTIEVKDKLFTPQDVQHAVNKVVRAGSRSLIFAVGRRGELKGTSYLELTKYWGQKGFNLYFIDVMNSFISILAIVPIIAQQEFVHIINYHAVQAKIKDDTFNHLRRCIKQLGW